MQANVHRFDDHTGAGSVITDDGLVLAFDLAALTHSGLRRLRVGQRLTVEMREQDAGQPPRVATLALAGIPPAQPRS
ncbi:MAG: cold-shock protein [Angustibacter sp.]